MIKLPQMFMIGSAGRNVGKTEFACSLIRKFANNRAIVGIKVTTITAKDGTCPRGGKGCGVCSSLVGEYCITDEKDAPAEKDTARLLAAGAPKVFWLRVMRTHLAEGISDLLTRVDKDAMLICESNSLRQVVQPGVFVMVKGKDADLFKESADEVKELVDKMVDFTGNGFEFDLDAVSVQDNRWALRETATAVIMAGGGSRRMGEDKAMLMVDGKPLIQRVFDELSPHFEDIIISGSDEEEYGFLGTRVVSDRTPGQGPLMGLASVLPVSRSELNLVVACDMPGVDMASIRNLLREVEGYDAVVACLDGMPEPLFAVYRKTVAGLMDELIEEGEHSIKPLFERCRTKFVELSRQEVVLNLNTREDFEEWIENKRN